MARPNELDNQFLDVAVQQDVRRAYGSIARFAAIAEIEYHVARRVLQNLPCKTEEIDLVMDMWIRFDPKNIKKLGDTVLADAHAGKCDPRALQDLVSRLTWILDGLQAKEPIID